MTQADRTHPSFLLRLRDQADQLSWPEFHARYGHMLYRYARSRGASHSDAEDAVQEVEMQLFQAIEGFEYDGRKGRFRSYLRAAVVHSVARRADCNAKQPTHVDPRSFDYVEGEQEARQDEKWMHEWNLQQLREAVSSVAGDFDQTTLKAFEIHVLAGRPAPEASRMLDVSVWSIYRARDRVLRRLKTRMTELEWG